MFKAALFDMDGVLNQYPDMFSRVYAEREGIDPKPIERFFKLHWQDVLEGNLDLKQLLVEHSDAWHLKGNPQQLLDDWFMTEDAMNKDLLEVVQELRRRGIKCYLATNNEPYRVLYARDHMFKDKLDGIFSSSNLGVMKPDRNFFERALKRLNLQPAEVAFFDDNPGHVEVAKSLGMAAYVYESPEQVRQIVQ